MRSVHRLVTHHCALLLLPRPLRPLLAPPPPPPASRSSSCFPFLVWLISTHSISLQPTHFLVFPFRFLSFQPLVRCVICIYRSCSGTCFLFVPLFNPFHSPHSCFLLCNFRFTYYCRCCLLGMRTFHNVLQLFLFFTSSSSLHPLLIHAFSYILFSVGSLLLLLSSWFSYVSSLSSSSSFLHLIFFT